MASTFSRSSLADHRPPHRRRQPPIRAVARPAPAHL